MTPKEFKAWFDGFTEAMEGMPTETQWEKIKQRVSDIDGTPISYPVYVDRHWPFRVSPWLDQPTYLRCHSQMQQVQASPGISGVGISASSNSFNNSVAALYACGRAEFEDRNAA